MGSRRRDDAQMILLAGILIVLAYLVFSTQTALLANVGQEAGREAGNPLLNDYLGVRSSLSNVFREELTESGVVACPTVKSDWAGRVQTLLELTAQLQANRGQFFVGHFLDANVPVPGGVDLETRVDLYLANADGSMAERVDFVTKCA